MRLNRPAALGAVSLLAMWLGVTAARADVLPPPEDECVVPESDLKDGICVVCLYGPVGDQRRKDSHEPTCLEELTPKGMQEVCGNGASLRQGVFCKPGHHVHRRGPEAAGDGAAGDGAVVVQRHNFPLTGGIAVGTLLLASGGAWFLFRKGTPRPKA